MTSITWAGPRCEQELATILAPQNRIQGRCVRYFSAIEVLLIVLTVEQDVILKISCVLHQLEPGRVDKFNMYVCQFVCIYLFIFLHSKIYDQDGLQTIRFSRGNRCWNCLATWDCTRCIFIERVHFISFEIIILLVLNKNSVLTLENWGTKSIIIFFIEWNLFYCWHATFFCGLSLCEFLYIHTTTLSHAFGQNTEFS